jgi:hypothetical protein
MKDGSVRSIIIFDFSRFRFEFSGFNFIYAFNYTHWSFVFFIVLFFVSIFTWFYRVSGEYIYEG